MNNRTKILKVKGDWQEVLNDCRSTVGKEYLDKEPSPSFKKKILIAEHSPIRNIFIKWMWNPIISWCATHWSRHKWECYIKTQRSDRTGIDRNIMRQDMPVSFTGQANTQHCIDTHRKRLCFQASPETREFAEDFKVTVHDEVDEYIGDALVPNCVYRGGCPEMQTCGYFQRLIDKTCGLILTDDIQERYDLYNDIFYKEVRKRLDDKN